MTHAALFARGRLVSRYNHSYWMVSVLALAVAMTAMPVEAQQAPLAPVTVDPARPKVQPKINPSKHNAARARPTRDRNADRGTKRNQQLATPVVPVAPPQAAPLNPDGSTTASGGILVQSPGFGPFGNIPQNDIPFAVNSVPQAIIEDQQAKTAADIVRNDPSVLQTGVASQFGYPGFAIRGFDVGTSQSNRIDGLPFTEQAAELIYDYERVDIFKGTTGLLYGFAEPGGVINYVSKKPLDQPYTNLSFNYISPTWFGGTADVSRRFGDGDQFGVRINLASHGGDLSINNQTNKDALAALALDWKPLPGTRVWFNASYSLDNYYGLQPNFVIGTAAVPAAPDASKLYGQSFDHHFGQTDVIEGGIDTTITPWLSGTVKAGEVAGYRDVRYTGATLLDYAGNYALRSNPDSLWHLTDYSAQAILTPHFEIGAIKNKMDIGVTFNRETEQQYSVLGGASLGNFNFANPHFIADPQPSGSPTFGYGAVNDFNNYVFMDTLDVTKYLTLIGGVSYSTTDVVDNVGDNYFQGTPTPSGAIIVKPVEGLSLYGSYIQGLQAGTQAATTFGGAPVTNPNAYLAPFVSTQYEAGVKYDMNNALQLNADIFQISEPNAVYTPNGGGASYTYSNNGQQRNRGFEFTAVGKIYEGLRIFSGFTYLSPEITQSQGGTLNGLQAIGIPRWKGNLFAEYDIKPVTGLTLMGGFYYTGSSYANGANTLYIPDYVTVDVGAKYVTAIAGRQTTFRFYVQNVNGSNHWVNATYGLLALGDPRTFKVDVSMRF